MIKKIEKYYLYFMMYAVIGWLYEVFLEVVVYRWGFSNRGVLFGPYLPVYGFGALLFIFCFYKLINNCDLKKRIIMIPVIFLGCMIVATGLELITSYICEFISGSWPWQTYLDYKINFQGRIALSPSIRFGIGGVIFLYLLQPFFEKLLDKLSSKTLNYISLIVFLVFLMDIIVKILFK